MSSSFSTFRKTARVS